MERSDGGRQILGLKARGWIAGLLVLVGIQCWLILGRSDYGRNVQLKLLLATLILSLIPPVNRFFFACLDRIRHPSPRAMWIAAVLIAILSALYFPFTGWYQGRNFMPKWQDELSYMIQFQMLSHGRLWMPQHPLADFFDSFQLLVKPVYASIYFPGAALMYAPMKWIGVPYWMASAAASGVVVGLMYLVMTELIDGVAGVLAVLMMVGCDMLRKLSLMIGGHPPVLLIGMCMIYCWLRWRRSPRPTGWAIAVGLLAGWAAITRPLDAIVFATPIGIDMLLSLRRQPLKKWLVTTASLVLPALPLLAVQVVFNIGVTGKWSQTPFELYADRDYPGTTLGFHDIDPNRRPVSTLPQKQKFHDEWTVPAVRGHQPGRAFKDAFAKGLPAMFSNLLPHRMMFVLLPAAVLGLFATRQRAILWLMIPLFLFAFAFYAFSLPHYGIICMPAVILTTLVSARSIETAWPQPGVRRALAMLLTLFIAIMSITEMAEFNRLVRDEVFDPDVLRRVTAAEATLPHKPAVILFHFPPDGNPHEEPVYNTGVAWPDDATVIRAHDLGNRNIEIFRYYAEHQPQRAFYLYDRADDSIRFLGFAPELAQASQ